MAEVTGVLTLRGAAQHAGVSINTMRNWAKNIPETKRMDDGSYQISKDSLMEFLRSKDTSPRGPRQGGSSSEIHSSRTPAKDYGDKLLVQVEGERDRLLEDLVGAQQRIKDLESQNTRLVTTLNDQMRDLTKTIVTITSQLQLPEPRQSAESSRESVHSGGTIIDAEHEYHEVSAAPKVTAVKKKSVKSKSKSATKKIDRKAKKNTLKKKTKKR